MKKRFFLLSIFLMGFFAFSQDLTFSSVCKSLSVHPNMTGNFLQEKTIFSINRTLRSSGVFIFSPMGIVWKTEKPFPSVMAVGSASVVQIMPDARKIVTDASQNQIFTGISKSISAMFCGDEKSILENFTHDFSSSGDGWTLLLSPKDSSVKSVISSIGVSGKMQGNETFIQKILITEASGDTVKYVFSNQRFPKELSKDEESYFAF